ncbi:hypothetical protein CA850_16905 [Micromonospora echinospora]|uniref:Uncharacterized protein n=1 Tax=Micromonospora echinospora TaxID=1877 RepID=A0A1C4WV16_MICEC|nr:hypothetical protein [Micromonospora echinospora]OZV79747.1 hypothetical protein CA850_16905 [Micromonospora echinospora]SCF00003.1 hypothetical protein GA0070618_2518 [Micromonospora echinospora]
MPQIDVDEETDSYLAFAAALAGLTKGQVVARLVKQVQGAAALSGGAETEPASVRIYADYAGHRTFGLFVPGPGRIEITSGPLEGETFRTPSEAAREIVKHYNPGVSPHRNGWGFFFVAANGAPLQSLRHKPA